MMPPSYFFNVILSGSEGSGDAKQPRVSLVPALSGTDLCFTRADPSLPLRM